MSSHEDILGRMGAANPATADDNAMDAEFALLTSLLDQRRSTMTDLDERRTEPTPPPIRRPRWRAATAFVGALVIVVGAIGIVALVRDGGNGVVGGPDPTSPPVLEVTPEDVPPPVVDRNATTITQPTTTEVLPPATPAYAWNRITIDGAVMPEGTKLSGVVHTGSAFWVFGRADGCAHVWTSPDGDRWTRLAMDPDSSLPCGAALSDVTVGPDALVAVGMVDDGPAIWVSTDGRAWAEVGRIDSVLKPSDVVRAVAAGADGYVAVGTGVWHSIDGFEWVQATTPWVADDGGDQFAFDYNVLTNVAFGSTGYVVLSDDGDWGKDVLVSPNGLDWTATDVLAGTAHDGTECYVHPNGVAAGPSGYVVVGDCVPMEAESVFSSAWMSSDGTAWTQVPYDEPAFGQSALMSSVAFDGGAYVAVGWTLYDEGDRATAWFSEDGVTWTRMELPGTGDSDMWDVAASVGTAVAIGQADGSAVLWRGER